MFAIAFAALMVDAGLRLRSVFTALVLSGHRVSPARTQVIGKVGAGSAGARAGRSRSVSTRTRGDPGIPWYFKPEQTRRSRMSASASSQLTVLLPASPITAEPCGHRRPCGLQRDCPRSTGKLFRQKLECFCFTEQTLSARSRPVNMPVVFLYRPRFSPMTRSMKDIDTLTLSYTFFASRQEVRFGWPTAARRRRDASEDL